MPVAWLIRIRLVLGMVLMHRCRLSESFVTEADCRSRVPLCHCHDSTRYSWFLFKTSLWRFPARKPWIPSDDLCSQEFNQIGFVIVMPGYILLKITSQVLRRFWLVVDDLAKCGLSLLQHEWNGDPVCTYSVEELPLWKRITRTDNVIHYPSS